MTDTKQTPGPWHEGSHRSVESQSGTICEVYSHMGIEEADANQKLIAAAPDLLASLREALKIIDAYRRVSGGDGDITAMNARAAIAKATGGAA